MLERSCTSMVSLTTQQAYNHHNLYINILLGPPNLKGQYYNMMLLISDWQAIQFKILTVNCCATYDHCVDQYREATVNCCAKNFIIFLRFLQ